MSLFDDNWSSSSSSCSGEDCGEGDAHLCASVRHGPCAANSSVTIINPTAGGGISRFTLTAEESKRAEERRRREAASRSQLHGVPKIEAGGGKSRLEGSRFYASMAEALRLRKDAREALLLQRIQKQRQEEANNADLVEKDLEVGVFVTPQYLAALKRQKNLLTASFHDGLVNAAAGGEEGIDHLEAYVRQLEEKRTAATLQSSSMFPGTVSASTNSSIDDGAKVATHAAQERHQNYMGPDVFPVEGDSASMTHTVLFSAPTSPTTVASLPEDGNINERGGDDIRRSLPYDSAPREAVCSEDGIHEAEESRKRHRADRHFMTAAAERFNARALEGFWVG
ncbi:hypothetical protein TraAM80_00639 [Trypanosoma rangeli]|uniref:Uncharacterized protein n=1 Tax=Trypanosoma rangeli TaxID=5698 RepID=A0A422P2P9_TRYRA|nr:uncharacterized protein TraAM80_00639 [Trypanosoma rangeli]RNF11944.1 hypothetical protein TraAM80_00639 [Trypanosoma rangeli]|eukprot:RNF11944.1 hypothetical protein TraAM80_00639 [Trypanosoma rangeli]